MSYDELPPDFPAHVDTVRILAGAFAIPYDAFTTTRPSNAVALDLAAVSQKPITLKLEYQNAIDAYETIMQWFIVQRLLDMLAAHKAYWLKEGVRAWHTL